MELVDARRRASNESLAFRDATQRDGANLDERENFAGLLRCVILGSINLPQVSSNLFLFEYSLRVNRYLLLSFLLQFHKFAGGKSGFALIIHSSSSGSLNVSVFVRFFFLIFFNEKYILSQLAN